MNIPVDVETTMTILTEMTSSEIMIVEKSVVTDVMKAEEKKDAKRGVMRDVKIAIEGTLMTVTYMDRERLPGRILRTMEDIISTVTAMRLADVKINRIQTIEKSADSADFYCIF